MTQWTPTPRETFFELGSHSLSDLKNILFYNDWQNNSFGHFRKQVIITTIIIVTMTMNLTTFGICCNNYIIIMESCLLDFVQAGCRKHWTHGHPMVIVEVQFAFFGQFFNFLSLHGNHCDSLAEQWTLGQVAVIIYMFMNSMKLWFCFISFHEKLIFWH